MWQRCASPVFRAKRYRTLSGAGCVVQESPPPTVSLSLHNRLLRYRPVGLMEGLLPLSLGFALLIPGVTAEP